MGVGKLCYIFKNRKWEQANYVIFLKKSLEKSPMQHFFNLFEKKRLFLLIGLFAKRVREVFDIDLTSF